MAKIFKSLRIKGMNYLKLFLISAFLATGCQKQEEEIIDDVGFLALDEFDTTHLMGDPIPSSQEFLIKETPSVE